VSDYRRLRQLVVDVEPYVPDNEQTRNHRPGGAAQSRDRSCLTSALLTAEELDRLERLREDGEVWVAPRRLSPRMLSMAARYIQPAEPVYGCRVRGRVQSAVVLLGKQA
jgi:hypothetical protein